MSRNLRFIGNSMHSFESKDWQEPMVNSMGFSGQGWGMSWNREWEMSGEHQSTAGH